MSSFFSLAKKYLKRLISGDNKFKLLIILSFLTLSGFLPTRQNLIFDSQIVVVETITPDINATNFNIQSTEFKSYLEAAGLPSVVKVKKYDIIVQNINPWGIHQRFSIDENDPVLSYFIRSIGTSTGGVDNHPGFDIEPNRIYKIEDIPGDIRFRDAYGTYQTCDTFENTRCSEWKPFDPKFQTLQVSAIPYPTQLSVIIQLVLIFLFWIIVINGLLEFFKK